MSRTPIKATLLEKLLYERGQLEESLAQLTPEQMEQPGVDQAWSVKDILAHLSVWDQRGLGWITAAVAGETPAIPGPGLTWDDADHLNDQTYRAGQEQVLDVVLAESRQAFEQVVSLIETLSEEDLQRPVRGQGKSGPRLVSTLVRWRYRHLRHHRQPIAELVKADPPAASPPLIEPTPGPTDGEADSPTDEQPNTPPPVEQDKAQPTAPYMLGHRIADMHEGERPRERLLGYGPSALSTAELLAILLRVGIQGENAVMMAQRLLTTFGGLIGLARTSAQELGAIKGLGEAKACQLLAALELGKRLAAASPEDRPLINSPADAANLVLLEMSLLDHEQLRVMVLDSKNRVQGIQTVYKGAVNSSQVRVAEVFREAIRHNHPALVVIHNHPSGDPTPSRNDIRITQDIVSAGDLLGIQVMDHLIIGQQTFVSMKERGLGF